MGFIVLKDISQYFAHCSVVKPFSFKTEMKFIGVESTCTLCLQFVSVTNELLTPIQQNGT